MPRVKQNVNHIISINKNSSDPKNTIKHILYIINERLNKTTSTEEQLYV